MKNHSFEVNMGHVIGKEAMCVTESGLSTMSVFFKALSDETRLKILFALLESGKCVMHISERVGMSQSAVSHQLSLLRRANLVKVSRSGKHQVYTISDEHVRLVLDMAYLHAEEKENR